MSVSVGLEVVGSSVEGAGVTGLGVTGLGVPSVGLYVSISVGGGLGNGVGFRLAGRRVGRGVVIGIDPTSCVMRVQNSISSVRSPPPPPLLAFLDVVIFFLLVMPKSLPNDWVTVPIRASSDVAFIMIVLIDLFVRQTSNQYVQIFALPIFLLASSAKSQRILAGKGNDAFKRFQL